jgi:hypothetical protein
MAWVRDLISGRLCHECAASGARTGDGFAARPDHSMDWMSVLEVSSGVHEESIAGMAPSHAREGERRGTQ